MATIRWKNWWTVSDWCLKTEMGWASLQKARKLRELITSCKNTLWTSWLEIQTDWWYVKEECKRYNNLLVPEKRLRSVTAHITIEKTCSDQWGGTALSTLRRLSAYVLETGIDSTSLGQWAWVLLSSDQKMTRVVVAYQPCALAKSSQGVTDFKQRQQYFQKIGDFRSPRTIFHDHITCW